MPCPLPPSHMLVQFRRSSCSEPWPHGVMDSSASDDDVSDSASEPWAPIRVRPLFFYTDRLQAASEITDWRAAILGPTFVELFGSCRSSSLILLLLESRDWACLVRTGKAVHSRLFCFLYLET